MGFLASLSSADEPAKPPKLVRVLDRVLGFSSVTIWWEPPDDTSAITGYVVLSEEPGTHYHAVANVSGPHVSWTEVGQLQSGRPYNFKVASMAASGMGHPSAPSHQILLPNTVPPSPTNFGPKQVSARQVRLIWELSGDVSHVRIHYQRDGQKDWVVQKEDGGMLSALIKDLLPSTRYRFRVQAWNALGPSLFSEISLKTHVSVPEKLDGLLVSKTECSPHEFLYRCTAQLSWNGVGELANGSPVKGYRVWVQTVPPDGGETVLWNTTAGPGNSTTLQGLHPMHWYRFIVATINAVGIGVRSDPSDWLLTPGTPTNPVSKPIAHPGAGFIQHNRLVIRWQQPETNGAGLFGYQIQMLEGKAKCVTHDSRSHPSKQALLARYYKVSDKAAISNNPFNAPLSGKPVVTRPEPELRLSDTQFPEQLTSFRLELVGWLYVAQTDGYSFLLHSCGHSELKLDNKLVAHITRDDPNLTTALHSRTKRLRLSTGFHKVTVNYIQHKR